MALFRYFFTKERKVATFYLQAAIGSTGAVTLDASRSKGVTSITRTDTGDYDVVLDQPVKCLLDYSVKFSKSDSASTIFKVEAETVPSNSATIGFTCQNASEASTDPASGSTMYASFTCRLSDED